MARADQSTSDPSRTRTSPSFGNAASWTALLGGVTLLGIGAWRLASTEDGIDLGLLSLIVGLVVFILPERVRSLTDVTNGQLNEKLTALEEDVPLDIKADAQRVRNEIQDDFENFRKEFGSLECIGSVNDAVKRSQKRT